MLNLSRYKRVKDPQPCYKPSQKWTKSIAVGSKEYVKEYVEDVKMHLGALAKGRTARQAGTTYQLQEPSVFYNGLFGVKNDDIGA